jgi:hypothetical protein
MRIAALVFKDLAYERDPADTEAIAALNRAADAIEDALKHLGG